MCMKSMPKSIRCTILRGGTSKGVYLKESDLPADAESRDRIILAMFGSPDKRQIDGLGGADPLTSKVCIIGPPPQDEVCAPGAQLSYTFGQVGIDEPMVDYRGLCGNLTAGVGAYAIWENLVRPIEPMTPVRIFNTNLNRLLVCEVPVENGHPKETGDYVVPGVPGSGAMIQVDFSDTVGGSTTGLLPTGNPVDRLDLPGIGALDVSLVDIGNAHVFVRARDLGISGAETAAAIDADGELCDALETIRAHAAAVMGIVSDPAQAKVESPAIPMVAMVASPCDYENVIEQCTVKAGDVDFLARLMFMQQMHKTYAATSIVCTGIASRIPGTVVREMCRPETLDQMTVRIGHPAGVIETESKVQREGECFVVNRATLGRTARRIFKGQVFV